MADNKNDKNKNEPKSQKPKDLPARPTDKKTDENVKGGAASSYYLKID